MHELTMHRQPHFVQSGLDHRAAYLWAECLAALSSFLTILLERTPMKKLPWARDADLLHICWAQPSPECSLSLTSNFGGEVVQKWHQKVSSSSLDCSQFFSQWRLTVTQKWTQNETLWKLLLPALTSNWCAICRSKIGWVIHAPLHQENDTWLP